MRSSIRTTPTLPLQRPRSHSHNAFRPALLCCPIAIVAASCGTQTSGPLTIDAAPPSAVWAVRSAPDPVVDGNESEDRASAKQLDALVRQRLHDRFDSDYPVGPGDVLEISVPDMPELRSQIGRA